MTDNTPQSPRVTSRAEFISSLPPKRTKSRFNIGLISVCALVILLLAQMIFWHQSTLFKHPKVYALANAIQHPLTQKTLHINAPDLARIDQHLATETATTTGTLQITGLLRNAGHVPITPPILRVVLEDHQGKSSAARNFTAAEYFTDQRLRHLEPGQRYTFTLNLQESSKTFGYRLSLR